MNSAKVLLENKKIKATILPDTGCLVAIEDKLNNVIYEFTEENSGFELITDNSTLFVNAHSYKYEADENSATFYFETEKDTVKYNAKVTFYIFDGAFIEKEISFNKETQDKWLIDNVVCQKLSLKNPAREILFHDDQSLWHVPLNYFYRYENTGLYSGLEYPYWETDSKNNNSVTIGYMPKYFVDGNEWFTCEKTFCGVYKKEGIGYSSHGPYPGKIKYNYYDCFAGSGLNQLFIDMQIPEDAGLPEYQFDWGEAWAMQDFFNHYLQLQQTPDNEFFVLQNGWWAGLNQPDLSKLDTLIKAGIKYCCMAATFYGHDNHPNPEPRYFSDARIDPFGFPVLEYKKQKITTIDDGWHNNVKDDNEPQQIITEYTEEFNAPEDYDKFIVEAEKLGVKINSFNPSNIMFKNKPEWSAKTKEGSDQTNFQKRIACFANKEYVDFMYKALCKMLDRYDAKLWGFDGKWFCYREGAGYGQEYIGPDPCYSDEHGHLPGLGAYAEWKNIKDYVLRIKERYPKLFLDMCWGIKRGGNWSLKGFNTDENYNEIGGIENNRFQAWHNENGRFRPLFLTQTHILGDEPVTFKYSVISSLSIGNTLEMSKGYKVIDEHPECIDYFKKWYQWGKDNYDYLFNRRTIFGMPGENTLDGSVHALKDSGYIFVFCSPKASAIGNITFNEHIGLENNPDNTFTVSIEELLPTTVETVGSEKLILKEDTVKYGDILSFYMSPGSCALLKFVKKDNNTTKVTNTLPKADVTLTDFTKI